MASGQDLSGVGAETTAALILRGLTDQGLSADDLDAETVAQHYARITRVKDGADLDAAARLMPCDPPTPVADAITGLIVETRRHANLPVVVRQAVAMGLRVQVVHGPGNAGFVRSNLAVLIASGQVILTALQGDRVTATSYNGLMLSPDFWQAMVGRGKVLIFQSDTVFCARSPHRPADFTAFDYIGPAWANRVSRDIRSFGGIGGFTLRDHALSVAALRRFDPARWPAGEDRYFAFHLELLGGRVAQPDESDRFCTQHRFAARSLGAHKLNGLSWWQQALFLAYCPQAWRILPRIEPRQARAGRG